MIAEAIHQITAQLPEGTRLVAVSKFHPVEAIREAYAAGQRLFGESHVQELRTKHEALSELEGLEWHFIGHLQTNKVKYIAPYVGLIHAVDSSRLLEEINKQAVKAGRVVRCLLQLHVAEEETKFGFTPDEALAYLDNGAWQQLTGVQLAGVMAMATNTDDTARIRDDFRRTRRFFERAQHDYCLRAAADETVQPSTANGQVSPFNVLSMGMSDDWPIAVEEGSTLIRVGTSIFGQREH